MNTAPQLSTNDPLLPSESVIIDGQTWFTAEALAEHLGYEEPTSVGHMLHRYQKQLAPLTTIARVPGSKKDRRLFGEEAVYQLILMATTPRSHELRTMMLRRMQDLQADLAAIMSDTGGRA
jgi:prophage antirepressor-like protein